MGIAPLGRLQDFGVDANWDGGIGFGAGVWFGRRRDPVDESDRNQALGCFTDHLLWLGGGWNGLGLATGPDRI